MVANIMKQIQQNKIIHNYKGFEIIEFIYGKYFKVGHGAYSTMEVAQKCIDVHLRRRRY